MRYVLAFIIIVGFNVAAAILSPLMGMTTGEVLAALAVGAFAVLAGDYYTTKEGR